MNLPNGEVNVLREGVDEQEIPWQQNENIQLSELQDMENYSPDWAAIKTALGVSSQAKGENTAGYLLARVLGLIPQRG